MKAYLLDEKENDGIFTGIGIVQHGVPFIPRTEKQEKLLSEDSRFKATRIKADEAPLTPSATVAPIAEAKATGKPTQAKGDK